MACSARTQLLMDPAELAELKALAKRRRTSVGRLIRDAVREKYLTQDVEKRRRAVEELAAMNLGPLPDWDALKEELDARYDDIAPYDDAVPRREHRPVRRRRAPRAP